MSKRRTAIPKATRDQVLKEFNHHCAVCNGDRPHLHHIDGDPTNHDPLNLLPLCPNCHLGDEHNPTGGIGQGRLSLFRRFKDPAILAPQFQALYRRLQFLDSVEVNEEPIDDLERAASELISFVRALEMGGFFGDRVSELVKAPPHGFIVRMGGGPDPNYERSRRRHNREYRQQLVDSREAAVALVVEQLRFQKWEPIKRRES